MRPIAAGIASVLLFILTTAHTGRAQAPENRPSVAPVGVVYRPPAAHYERFRTAHFDLVYQQGWGAEAREAAHYLERDLPKIQRVITNHRPFRLPAVINGFNDRANGYVSTLPFRTEIEGVRLKGPILNPRHPSWMSTVAPHELVHAVHANAGRGLGLGALTRLFAPDLARGLTLATAAGLKEGIAVYLETQVEPGAGRLRQARFQMQYRAAMASDRPWSLAQMLESTAYAWPADRHYIGGAHLVQYLMEHENPRFFPRAVNLHYRLPFLGAYAGLWRGTGERPRRLQRALRRHARDQERARLDTLGPLTEVRRIASARGLLHRAPRWLDDRTLVVYARGYALRPGFYRIDAQTGARRLLRAQPISEDYRVHLAPDRSALYFSRYVADRTVRLRSVAEAFRLDVPDGRVQRLTRGGRIHAPVRYDGALWAVQNEGSSNQLVRIGEDGTITRWTDFEHAHFDALLPSPDGRHLAAILNVRGHQGLFRLMPRVPALASQAAAPAPDAPGAFAVRPWLLAEEATIYNAAWSADSRYLLFEADLGGVSNLYAYDIRRDEIRKLTNVPYGALEPALSPDGTTLAFVHYEHERYDLVTIPFVPDEAPVVPRAAWAYGRAMPWEAWLSTAPAGDAYAAAPTSAYRPLRYLRPRLVEPIFALDEQEVTRARDVELGVRLGLGLSGNDPLQTWAYTVRGFYQHERLWGDVTLQTGRSALRPFVRAFTLPETRLVRIGEEPARVGVEERGVRVGLMLPLTLASGVFRSGLTLGLEGQWEAERLFGADNETLRGFRDRITLLPSMRLLLGVQRNRRDLVPNTGFVVATRAEVDAWAERAPARQALVTSATWYLPFLRRHNTGLMLRAGLLAQSRGGLFNLDRFVPRGHEEAFLGEGTFAKVGFETIQPLRFVDDGLLLLPAFLHVVYGYGFAETLFAVDGEGETPLSSAGAGLGCRLQLWHLVDLDLRLGVAYRIEARDWRGTAR